jgi:hypothetical protein
MPGTARSGKRDLSLFLLRSPTWQADYIAARDGGLLKPCRRFSPPHRKRSPRPRTPSATRCPGCTSKRRHVRIPIRGRGLGTAGRDDGTWAPA